MIQILKILLEFQFLPFPSQKKTFIDVLNYISPIFEQSLEFWSWCILTLVVCFPMLQWQKLMM